MSMTRRRLLDDTFKKSVVGNPAIATDSLARMYPGITMQGWTEQDGTPTPEVPVPIVSAGTQNQETGKWKYEVEVGCGNLINESDAIYNDAYFTYENGKFTCVSGASTYVYFEKVLSAGEYFWSVNCDEISGSGKIQVRNQSNEVLFGNTFSDPGKKNLIFTLEETTECRLLFGDNSNSAITFSKPMLNPGTTALPYTPYRPPQTVTLTADRPLTKWDKLEKRNGQWGWVYKSGVKQLISDMNIIKNPEGTYQVTNFAKVDRNRLAESLSTHFIYKLATTEYGNFWFDSAGTGLRFRMSQFQTIEEVKDWLQENEVYFAFPNAEETFVPLSAAEQEAMNALHTFRPTTVLSNDCECSMSLTYKTKKSLEVTT